VAGNQAVTVLSGGNVGIGTTNPKANLDVSGNVTVLGGLVTSANFRVGGSGRAQGRQIIHRTSYITGDGVYFDLLDYTNTQSSSTGAGASVMGDLTMAGSFRDTAGTTVSALGKYRIYIIATQSNGEGTTANVTIAEEFSSGGSSREFDIDVRQKAGTQKFECAILSPVGELSYGWLNSTFEYTAVYNQDGSPIPVSFE